MKPYTERLEDAVLKTGLKEAMSVAEGKINKRPLVIAAMDFRFIGGSMGAVVKEGFAKSVDHCIANQIPLLIISKSGGARMMESAFSLMQMAKTSAKLSQLAAAKLPYFSLMTDPTTGGVTASFAMLGDINMAAARCVDRICRTSRHSRDNQAGPSRWISEFRIFDGTRFHGFHRPSERVERKAF